MPTKPLDSILYRELSKVQANEIIEIASPLLQELVNYSTNVLARCATSPSNEVDVDLSVLALYRHILEMTDGVEVLIVQCCADAAIPLLRSAFEALISIEYILENDAKGQYKDFNRRSLAWLLNHVHNRLDLFDRFDFSTNKGIETKKLFEDDLIASTIGLPDLDIDKARENLLKILDKPHMKSIEEEYEKCKKRKRYNWYSLFGGPTTMRQLAINLKQGAHYEMLYRPWSISLHAQDFFPFIKKLEDGESVIRPLRNPESIQQVVGYAAGFILKSTRLVLGKFRPTENVTDWYIREVQKNYRKIFVIPN
jgi:hypothetical protein